MSIPSMRTGQIDWYAAAEDAVRRYCGWHVAPVVERTVIVRVMDSARALLLPTGHLVELLAVRVGGVDVDVSTLEWSPDGIVTGTTFHGVVTVKIRDGYEESAHLAGLIEAIGSRAKAAPDGATRTTVGQVSITRGSLDGVAPGIPLMASERAALESYRIEVAP